MRKLRALDETLPVVMISGHGTTSTAVDAIKSGAIDFLDKPLSSERVIVTLQNVLKQQELRQENRELKLAMESRYEIVGDSPALRAVLEAVKRAAPTNATVMLLGESGVGKELVARTIHRNSPRAGQRFVQVNCAAIPEELIESELFGHEKGSFTGATEKQIGKFEQADRGTIFLDEVGDMSPKTQAKVLRVLQEQEVERLGSARTIKVDVRVIAATNKDLEEGIQRGEFREDLFFRLNVIPIVVPPLRERRGDIPQLVQHFARRTSEEHNLKPKRFDARAMEALQRYRWRGNIRELRNTVERLMIMTPGDVGARGGSAAGHPRRRPPRGCRCRTRPPQRRQAPPLRGLPRPSRAGRCGSSRTPRNAPTWCRSCARTTGTSRRPPRSSIPRAAISTRSWNSTGLSRKWTGNVRSTGPTAGSLVIRDLRPCDNRLSQSARRPPAFARAARPTAEAGGKSELRRAVRRVTPGQGNLTE